MASPEDVQLSISPREEEGEEEKLEESSQKATQKALGMSITEVLRYLFFSIITVIVILNQLNISQTYDIERGITDDILSSDTFEKISNATDIIDWLGDYFVPKVLELDFYPYNEELYKNTQARMAWFNIVTTTIRIVQKRVNLKDNPSDRNADQVKKAWETLDYDIFQSGASGEYTEDYGPIRVFKFNENIGADSSGGYLQNLNATVVKESLEAFKKATNFLVENNWVDRQTIALYIDLSTYNGHNGMLSYIRILVQVAASGSVTKNLVVTSLNIEPYSKGSDVFRVVLELIFILMSLLYAAIEVYKIKLEVAAKKTEFMEDGMALNVGIFKMVWEGIKVHFSHFWNWMDFASVTLSFIIIGLWIQYISSDLIANGPSADTLLDDLVTTLTIYNRYTSACAINLLLIFIRILKYLSRFERIALILNTFDEAKDDIFYFFILLITVFLAFVIFGHVAFGGSNENFSSMGNSMLACFFLLFGDSKVYFEIKEAYPLESTVFFFLFTFFIIFILINMFIAIINNKFSENIQKLEEIKKLQVDEDYVHPLLAVWNRFKEIIRNILDYCNKHRRIAKKYAGAERSLMKTKDDVQVKFAEYNLNYGVSTNMKEFIDSEVLTDKEILGRLAEITKTRKVEVKAAVIFVVFALTYAVTLIQQSQIGTKFMLSNTVRTAVEEVKYDYQEDFYNVNQIFNYETFFLWSEEFPKIFKTRATGEKYINDNILIGHNITTNLETYDQGPIRLTLRRVKMIDNPSKQYDEYQDKVRKGSMEPFTYSSIEDDAEHVGGSTGFVYETDPGNSFMDVGGVVLFMSSDYFDFNTQLKALKSDLILNDTSALLVYDFILYNGNVNNLIYTAIIFEFNSGGRIMTSLYIWPLELQMYTTPAQVARAVFECVYIILLLYHIVETCIALKQQSDNYTIWQRQLYEVLTDEQKRKRWNMEPEWMRRFFAIVDVYLFIDLLSYIFALMSIAAWSAYLDFTGRGPVLPEVNSDYFDAMDTLAKALKYYLDLSSVCLLLMFFRLLKYMQMSKSLSFLQNTIGAAVVDLYYYIIMLVSLLFGFVFLAYIAFGPHSDRFSTISKSLITCFEMLIGEFDYANMKDANPDIAPFFFVFYLLLFVFIMLNIFIAILERSYSIVKQNNEEERSSPVKFLTVLIEFCFRRLRSQPDDRDYEQEEHQHILPEEVFVKLDNGLDGEVDPESWALRFSEHILMERAKRSQAKNQHDILYKRRKNREMQGKAFTISNSARRAEKKLRLQFWNYLRVGYQSLKAQEKLIKRETRDLVSESKQNYEQFSKLHTDTEELYQEVAEVERELLEINKKIAKKTKAQAKSGR
jgi:hypothetical protein